MVKRIPWKAFCIAIVAILLLVAAVLVSAMRQKSTFNDSDLIYSRIEVPVESNAFWTLDKVTNELYWPESLEGKLGDLSDNTNWDDALAADVLQKNAACLDAFDRSLRQPFLLIPAPKEFGEDYPYLSSWKAFSHLESIRAISLFRAKQEKNGLDSALEILEFGHRVENAGGGTLHYMVGSAIKMVGLRCIREMMARTALQEADMISLIRELNDFRPNKAGLTNALKVDYQIDTDFLDDNAGLKATNSVFEQIGVRTFVNPIKTKMEFAQSARFVRDNIPRPFAEIPWSNLPVLDTNAPMWKRVLNGNVLGEMLVGMESPSLQRISTRKSREDVDVTATRLLLALKIYKMRCGKLPESLSALAPEFFPQVPIDDFDGRPFRYLPDKKLIYSVGPDLKDLSGQDFHKDSTNYNLPFKIEF
jgi:hypothetical protein